MDAAPFENELTYASHEEAGRLEEFHREYESAVERVTASPGGTFPHVVDGDAVEGAETFTVASPGDTALVVGEFAAGDEAVVDDAVAAASAAFDGWRRTDWQERVAVVRAAADVLVDRKYDLAATVTVENGKNRTESMADVDEAVDFLRFYSRELERHEGYALETGEPTPGEHCRNLRRPYGVFAVVAPFNFPLAILAGMTTGAIVTGNTAVVKPASATPRIAHAFLDALERAGLPEGVVNLVTGSGSAVGDPLVSHEDVAGVAFTGSREVGRQLQRTFLESGKPGPVVAELGGKNPVVVTAGADLEKAVSGVTTGAFSFAGQKCSATSRVYVHEAVAGEFTDRLVAATEALTVRPPHEREAVVSPVVDDDALERYREVCAEAREAGTLLTGGVVVDDAGLPSGRYVRPTVAVDVPHDHRLAREEHFLPFVTVHPVGSLAEAIERSNDSDFGLCAGLFSEDEAEVEAWLDRVEAGMCYVNRGQSATTGALVGAQPFGGWKDSGATGSFAGGYWYLPQFTREQTRTVVGDIGR
jgi:1-pyrroline-5-carboxylate dehydrogenase